MLNIYRGWFTARCPNNGKRITYNFELHLRRRVLVETIIAYCDNLTAPAYHEAIADKFLNRFGGFQIIRASHHGIEIETHRGKR